MQKAMWAEIQSLTPPPPPPECDETGGSGKPSQYGKVYFVNPAASSWTQNIQSMMVYCWPSVADNGPALKPTLVEHLLFADEVQRNIYFLCCMSTKTTTTMGGIWARAGSENTLLEQTLNVDPMLSQRCPFTECYSSVSFEGKKQ